MRLAVLLCLFLPFVTSGQPQASLLGEINSQVWVPFSAAYAAKDADVYLALHTPALVRVSSGSGISTLKEYGESVRAWWVEAKSKGQNFEISFRFTERVAKGDMASERGIYRLVSTNLDGSRHESYGRFHVILRKQNGRWHLDVDYDSNEGGSVTAETYSRALAQEELTRWDRR
jgi:ketosteroid isomerase-like protein